MPFSQLLPSPRGTGLCGMQSSPWRDSQAVRGQGEVDTAVSRGCLLSGIGSPAGQVHVFWGRQAPCQPAGEMKFLKELSPPLSPEGPSGISQGTREERAFQAEGTACAGDKWPVVRGWEQQVKVRQRREPRAVGAKLRCLRPASVAGLWPQGQMGS